MTQLSGTNTTYDNGDTVISSATDSQYDVSLDWAPAVSVAHRPAERAVACASDPDGRVRLADGTRSGVDVGERDVPTLVGGDVLRPQRLDGREAGVFTWT